MLLNEKFKIYINITKIRKLNIKTIFFNILKNFLLNDKLINMLNFEKIS